MGLLITVIEGGEQCVLDRAGVGEGPRVGQKGWWLLLMVTVSARIHRWLGSEFRQASRVWGRAFPLPPVELQGSHRDLSGCGLQQSSSAFIYFIYVLCTRFHCSFLILKKHFLQSAESWREGVGSNQTRTLYAYMQGP